MSALKIKSLVNKRYTNLLLLYFTQLKWNINAYFILLYDMCRDLSTSRLQSFVSDFFEPKSHTEVSSGLQFQQ